ncbi:MAG: hypothetical protein JSS49_22950 [Planctomycetes bacterium]|nr:hypothetical protein [Planctomycetota bacterium]
MLESFKRVCPFLAICVLVAALGGCGSKAPVPVPASTSDRSPEPAATATPPPREYLKIRGAVKEPPEWLAADAPFDLHEVFPVLRDDENAAPLYLETLNEFNTEIINSYPVEQQESLYQRYRPRATRLHTLHQAWEADRQSVSAEELDTFLKEYDLGFEKLAEAQKRTRCVFETGITISSLVPHTQAIRSVARVVQMQTARDLEHGELERPLRLLEILLRATRDLRYRGFVITQLAATVCESVAYKAIGEIVNSPHCTIEHCDRLFALLSRHENQMPDGAGIAVKMEYIALRVMMRDIEFRTGEFTPENIVKLTESFGAKGGTVGTVLAVIGGDDRETADQRGKQIDSRLALLTAADYEREASLVRTYFQELLKLVQQPYPQANEGLNRLLKTGENSLFLNLFKMNSSFSWENILSNAARSKAFLNGTRSLIAIRRWQLEGRQPPTDLARVTQSAGLKGVPEDPFSGSALKLITRSGQTVVYSIGPDLVDDQGLLEAVGFPTKPGDYLFRLTIPFANKGNKSE